MEYALIFGFVFYSLMILAIGFNCGRAERSSARISKIYEPVEHGPFSP